jgi:hypothetical protein
MKSLFIALLLFNAFTALAGGKQHALAGERQRSIPGERQHDVVPVRETRTDLTPGNEDKEKFIFRVYDTPVAPQGETEPHFLGNEIAGKWTVVNELYLQKGEISIGFSTSYTDIAKPAIFNAVCRINNHYKKAVGKGMMSREDARAQFSKILDCAIAAFHCDETEKFETTLMKVRDAVQLIRIFGSVKIEVL